jgi:hypothetical protein
MIRYPFSLGRTQPTLTSKSDYSADSGSMLRATMASMTRQIFFATVRTNLLATRTTVPLRRYFSPGAVRKDLYIKIAPIKVYWKLLRILAYKFRWIKQPTRFFLNWQLDSQSANSTGHLCDSNLRDHQSNSPRCTPAIKQPKAMMRPILQSLRICSTTPPLVTHLPCRFPADRQPGSPQTW